MPAQNQYDHITHLSISDISIDNKDSPQLLRIWIKTDPFCQGVDIYVPGEEICLVRGILPYLVQRGSHPGPLFLFQDDRMLTRHLFSTAVNELLTKLHIDKRLYNMHSFRIRAATYICHTSQHPRCSCSYVRQVEERSLQTVCEDLPSRTSSSFQTTCSRWSITSRQPV